mgnify:CR=1 FL=1
MRGLHEKRKTVGTARSHTTGFAATLYDYVGAIVAAMVLLVLLFTFVFRAAGVLGDSMQPTLQDGDRLVLFSHFYTPARGDVVVINRYTEEPLIKRVIGVAGDRVHIDETTGLVYVNGERLSEPYISGLTPPREMAGEVTVPEGCLFVMGLETTGIGARHEKITEIGMVKVSDVVGQAIFRLWPFKKFGLIG